MLAPFSITTLLAAFDCNLYCHRLWRPDYQKHPRLRWNAGECVDSAAMHSKLVCGNSGVQRAVVVIVGRLLIACAVATGKRLRECRRAKAERCNARSQDEL